MSASLNSRPLKLHATSSGFTLVELMVTIAVLAIIAGIATPNISLQIANQRAKSTAATLNTALREAKVESIIRRQILTMTYTNKSGSADSGSISVKDPSDKVVATYQYDARSTIKSATNSIKFRPTKIADERVYTICDSNTSASPRQVSVNALATITQTLGGICV